MSPSARLTSQQLKEIIEEEKATDQSPWEIQEQVDGEEVLDPGNTSSALDTVLNTINNEFEHECLQKAVRLLNAHRISQFIDDRVYCHKYWIPGLPGRNFLVHQVWAIWFIVRRCVWDADMPEALVADGMGLGKTFTSVAAAMICKILTEKVVMGLPLSIVWGNTLAEWVDMVQNEYPGMIGEQRDWYPLQRYNSVPHRPTEIQESPPQRHPELKFPLEPILVVRMPGVADTFKSVINEITFATYFKLIKLLHAGNANLTHEDLNTSLGKPENRWSIHLVLYDTLTSRAKPSSNGQLSHCLWSFVIFDESHHYKTKNSVGWRIVMNAKIGFKLQVTATLGFHSLYDWCFQTLWLFSGASEDPEHDTVMEKPGAEELYSAMKSSTHAIQTEAEHAQLDAAHQMKEIAKTWTIRRWSESKLTNEKPCVRILKERAHLVDLEWTEEEQAKLTILVERYTSLGASGVWRVYRWWLACYSLVLGDTENRNDVSSQWHNEWPPNTWLNSPIFRSLRDTFLPMLGKEPVEYPKPEEDKASNETLLHQPESYKSTLPRAPPPQQAVLFCPLPGQVRHLKYWLTKCFANQLDIFYMYAEMSNNERTKMQLKSLCVRNYTPSGWDRPRSHSSKPWGNTAEVLGIEWAAPGICKGCLTGGKTQFYTPGYWTLDQVVMITERVISTSSLE